MIDLDDMINPVWDGFQAGFPLQMTFIFWKRLMISKKSSKASLYFAGTAGLRAMALWWDEALSYHFLTVLMNHTVVRRLLLKPCSLTRSSRALATSALIQGLSNFHFLKMTRSYWVSVELVRNIVPAFSLNSIKLKRWTSSTLELERLCLETVSSGKMIGWTVTIRVRRFFIKCSISGRKKSSFSGMAGCGMLVSHSLFSSNF